jgi:hypothetical protein
MILKLTLYYSGIPLLVDTTSIVISEGEGYTRIYQQATDEADYYIVQETIEEIEQQIKNGGICGTK